MQESQRCVRADWYTRLARQPSTTLAASRSANVVSRSVVPSVRRAYRASAPSNRSAKILRGSCAEIRGIQTVVTRGIDPNRQSRVHRICKALGNDGVGPVDRGIPTSESSAQRREKEACRRGARPVADDKVVGRIEDRARRSLWAWPG
jgi:hypothetical protein